MTVLVKSISCLRAILVLLMFVAVLSTFDCCCSTAAEPPQSAQEKKRLDTLITNIYSAPETVDGARKEEITQIKKKQILRVVNGDKVAPGEEEWQKICAQQQNVPFPATDQPTAEDAASLVNCNSYDLYYGVKQPADPVKARLCAYDRMNKKGEDGPFSGKAMLMTIYANGVGGTRNLPLAIKLACNMGEAPLERESRVIHLEQLRKQKWDGSDFSLCDNISSSFMLAVCATHNDSISARKRDEKLKDIEAKWSDSEKTGYLALRQAADRYFARQFEAADAQDGTASHAEAIEERAALEDEFFKLLQDLNQGKLSRFSHEQFVAADSVLNTVYRKIGKNDKWLTLSQREGIKIAQREWIRYRDAWVAFCKIKDSKVDPDSIKTILTRLRITMLEPFSN